VAADSLAPNGKSNAGLVFTAPLVGASGTNCGRGSGSSYPFTGWCSIKTGAGLSTT